MADRWFSRPRISSLRKQNPILSRFFVDYTKKRFLSGNRSSQSKMPQFQDFCGSFPLLHIHVWPWCVGYNVPFSVLRAHVCRWRAIPVRARCLASTTGIVGNGSLCFCSWNRRSSGCRGITDAGRRGFLFGLVLRWGRSHGFMILRAKQYNKNSVRCLFSNNRYKTDKSSNKWSETTRPEHPLIFNKKDHDVQTIWTNNGLVWLKCGLRALSTSMEISHLDAPKKHRCPMLSPYLAMPQLSVTSIIWKNINKHAIVNICNQKFDVGLTSSWLQNYANCRKCLGHTTLLFGA